MSDAINSSAVFHPGSRAVTGWHGHIPIASNYIQFMIRTEKLAPQDRAVEIEVQKIIDLSFGQRLNVKTIHYSRRVRSEMRRFRTLNTH